MADTRPLPVSLYLGLARLAEPFYRSLHRRRVKNGKDDPARAGERFGQPVVARPSGQLIWVHAASVGETNSVLPLIKELTDKGHPVLLTTVTRTSAEIAEKTLPDGAVHQYAPFDSPRFLDGFLDHWRPALALLVESEIWPATFLALKERGCPVLLVNGRMSSRSQKRWSILSGAARYIFGSLDLTLPQSKHDGERFRSLGCEKVEFAGNLKFDSVVPEPSPIELEGLRQAVGNRKIWLAALTHPGEEEAAFEAHLKVLVKYPDALLVLVPRHPERRNEIMDLARQKGFSVSARSEGAPPALANQVYLGDTLGEMGLFYSLVKVAFLGGSVTDRGGHNPLEAIQFETALVSGTHVSNARIVYRDLWADNAVRKIEKADDLGREIIFLLENDAECAAQIARATKIIENGRGALERVLAHIDPYLQGSKT